METAQLCCIGYGEGEKQDIHSPDALRCLFSSSFSTLILPGFLSFHFLEICITPLLIKRTLPAPPLSGPLPSSQLDFPFCLWRNGVKAAEAVTLGSGHEQYSQVSRFSI